MEKTAFQDLLPAPLLPPIPEDKWRREQRAFHRLLPTLLAVFRDQYVAIHEERVVENGPEKLEVARQAYARCGYQPIFVSLVTDQLLPPVRLPSPRPISSETQE